MFDINLQDIPLSPGVYTFLDGKDRIIYVGKAKSLRSRLSSYFNAGVKNIKTERMLQAAKNVRTIVTNNEVEAFLLEMNLIKTEQPKYNILLKDSKSYPYVKLTLEEYPRLIYTRNTNDYGAVYFGPFVEAGELREIMEYLRESFPLRTCTNQQFNKGRICMKYQIKRCYGPCEGFIGKEDYNHLAEDVKNFFRGDTGLIKQDLQKRMENAAESLQFEQAAFYRDRLRAVSKLFARQQALQINESRDLDLFFKYESQSTVSVTQLFVRGGRLLGVKTHFFSPDEDDLLERFITQFYANVRQFPDLVAADGGEISANLQDLLSGLAGKKVQIRKRGFSDLFAIAEKNAVQASKEFALKASATADLFPRLSKIAGKDISRVECIDISHLGGDNTVGVSISSENGEFDKKGYRKYRIKSAGNNDVMSIKEVMSRKMENINDGSEQAADLYLIDGGVSQLNAAVSVLMQYGSPAACLSISEGRKAEDPEDKNSIEEVHEYKRKNPLKFRKNDPVLLFLQKMRDEAHRFAITYSRQLSLKKRHISPLLNVEGVGIKRAKQIMLAIPDLYTKGDLTPEYIRTTAKIPAAIAEKVFDFVKRSTGKR